MGRRGGVERREIPILCAGVFSKLWNNFHRPELVKKGVLESLAALRVSYLDLCERVPSVQHPCLPWGRVFPLSCRPHPLPRRLPVRARARGRGQAAPPRVLPHPCSPDVTEATSADEVEAVPLEDTWLALEKLVDEGLVRNIGVSNFEIEHLKRVQAVACVRPSGPRPPPSLLARPPSPRRPAGRSPSP